MFLDGGRLNNLIMYLLNDLQGGWRMAPAKLVVSIIENFSSVMLLCISKFILHGLDSLVNFRKSQKSDHAVGKCLE